MAGENTAIVWDDEAKDFDYFNDVQQKFPGAVFTSGFRTPEYQEDMRRRGYKPAKNSAHLRGDGLDIKEFPGMSLEQGAALLREAYPKAKILYGDKDHLDHVHMVIDGFGGFPDFGGQNYVAGSVQPDKDGIVWDDDLEKNVTWGEDFQAPNNQSTAKGPDYETYIKNGFDKDAPDVELSPETQDWYVSALKDPNIPFSEINLELRRRAAKEGKPLAGNTFDETVAKEYRDAYLAGQQVSDQVTYESGLRPIMQQNEREVPEEASNLDLMVEEGLLYNPMNIGVNWLFDLTDQELNGGVTKDLLREHFPDASADDIEALHDEMIGVDLRSQRDAVAKALDERDVSTLARFGVSIPTGLSPADIIPVAGRGAGLAVRGMEAVGGNMILDAAMQGSDIAYGAQDNFSNTQNIVAGLTGAGFHGALELGAAGIRAIGVSEKGTPYVDVETGDGNVKRIYKGKTNETPKDITETVDNKAFEGEEVPSFLKNPVKAKGYGSSKPRGKGKAPQPIEESGRGIKLSDAETRTRELTSGWKNSPEFLIANNVDDLDDKLAAAITADEAEGALGVTLPDGRVLLLTDNMVDLSELDGVVFHEALGHVGLNTEYGAGLDDLLIRMDEGNAKLKAAVNEWMDANPEAYGGNRARAIEEVLAEQSEAGAIDASTWNAIKAYVAKWARKLGIKDKGYFSDAEVREILRQGHERIINGDKGISGIDGTRYIRTWHASRADFTEFNDDYLMTGEGAMAYGAGHYTAEAGGTRTSYAEKFSTDDTKLKKKHNDIVINNEGQTWKEWLQENPVTVPTDSGPERADRVFYYDDLSMEVLQNFRKELFDIFNKDWSKFDIADALFRLSSDYRHEAGILQQNPDGSLQSLSAEQEVKRAVSYTATQLMDQVVNLNSKNPARVYEVELPDEDWLDFDAPMSAFKQLEKNFPDKVYWKNEETSTYEKIIEEGNRELLEIQKDIDELEHLITKSNDEDYIDLRKEDLEEIKEVYNEIQNEVETAKFTLEIVSENVEGDIKQTGSDAYYEAARIFFDGDERKLSKYLNEQGVPGNRFLDGFSRGKPNISSQIREINERYAQSIEWVKEDIKTEQRLIEGEKESFKYYDNREADIEKYAYANTDETNQRAREALSRARKDSERRIKISEDALFELEEKLKNLETQKQEELDKLKNLTRNYVSYNPDEMKIVNKFYNDENLPPAEIHTNQALKGWEDEGVYIPTKQEAGTFLVEKGLYSGGEIYQMPADNVKILAIRNGFQKDNGNRYMKRRDRVPSKLKLNPKKQKQREMLGNVSGQRFKSKRAVHEIIQEAADLAPEPTRESFASIDARAREMDLGFDEIMNLNEGMDPAQAHAVGIALVREAEKVDRLSKAIARGEASDAQVNTFAESFLRMGAIYEEYSKIANNAGRLLAAFKIAKQSSENAGLRFRLGEADADFADQGSIRALADKIANSPKQLGSTVKKNMTTSDMVGNVLNLPRSIMSSTDLSAPLRQGLPLITTANYWKSFFNMFRVTGSKDAFEGMVDDIMSRPTYGLMRQAGLSLTDAHGYRLSSREEDFMSPLAEKIPGLGKLVQGSERAFLGFLNKLRADTFDTMLKGYEQAGIELTDKALKDIATYVNSATGRGKMPKSAEQGASMLNALFFSPRLFFSRVNLLNPLYYARLDGPVRKEAIKNTMGMWAVIGTAATLASLNGYDVELDPRSSDFLKIRDGTKRYDIAGGFGQYLTLIARIATNESKTIKGEINEAGNGPFDFNRANAIGTFIRNKTSPIASFLWDWAEGQNTIGERFSVTEPFTDAPEGEDPIKWNKNAIIARMIPMFIQDVIEVVQEDPSLGDFVGLAPALFGVGYQDFEAVPEEEGTAEETDKMKEFEEGIIWDDE